jgi:uncharacterized protein
MTVRTEYGPGAETHRATASMSSGNAAGVLRSRPLLSFVLLAFGLSWLVWIPLLVAAPDAVLLWQMGAFGPAVAGAVMARAHGQRVRDWLRSMAIFRVRARWYVVALGLPLFEPVIQAVIVAQTGQPLSLEALAGRVPMATAMFVMMLVIGGGQEEPGWRGWLLPGLQARTNALAASLVIGCVWAVWHLPLFAGPNANLSFWLYLPWVVAMSIVFTWLWNSTGGSVVLAMLLHAQINTAKVWLPVADVEAFEASVSASYVTTVQAALASVGAVIALSLVALHGSRLGAEAEY